MKLKNIVIWLNVNAIWLGCASIILAIIRNMLLYNLYISVMHYRATFPSQEKLIRDSSVSYPAFTV